MNFSFPSRPALLFAMVLSAVTAAGAGFMQVRNLTRENYEGGPQNWGVVQDSPGRVYVANRDGLLVFDGARWEKHVLPNYTTVRSLLYDGRNGRIYAGGSEEFGFFAPDSVSGQLSYTSLRGTLPTDAPPFTEVWDIMQHAGSIWFRTDNHLLQFTGDTTAVFAADNRISSSALIDGTVFLGYENGGIGVLEHGTLRTLPGTEILAGKKIAAILPAGDSLIVATPFDGLFSYHRTARPMHSDIDGFLKNNQLFCAATNGDNYVFGTVSEGAVVKNFRTGRTSYVNREGGLQNNTVLAADFDCAGNIWFSLDNGLDYGIFNSPVKNLLGSASDIGAGYTSYLEGNTMYFGTNQGLYSAPYPFVDSPESLRPQRLLHGQIWALTPAGNGSFFVAADGGAYLVHSGVPERIHGLAGTYRIQLLGDSLRHAIAACYDGFALLRADGDRWLTDSRIGGDMGVRGTFELDSDGNLWIGHWQKGVYRLHYNPRSNSFDTVKLYTDADGLASASGNVVTPFRDGIIVSNLNGFYAFDRDADRFAPDSTLSTVFNGMHPECLLNSAGRLVALAHNGMYVARFAPDGSATSTFTPIQALGRRMVNGFEHAGYLSADQLILSNQEGFWNIDLTYTDSEPYEARPFVNAVYAMGDSLIYRATSDSLLPMPVIPYECNSLRFDFACPEYSSEGSVHYSSMLEDYDSGWSPFAPDAFREYTRLDNGEYILRLRALNLHTGSISETNLRFSIAPPWYLTVYARLAYALLAVLVTTLGIFLVNRWKRNALRRMEHRKEEEMDAVRAQAQKEALQKDYEIATLKSEQLEIDIKHKSNELSNATMNVIRKNEILQEIASRIARLQASAGLESAAQRQLSYIQSTIKDNISHDDDLATFNHNFDIVYGDYTKRLRKMYPQLTAADVRLCCYIKMGLSSKEIAPLINISFKSVEMARYRLRKKMELNPDTTLTDYLANF